MADEPHPGNDPEAWLGGLIHAVNNPLTYIHTNLASLRRDLRDVLALLEAHEAVMGQLGPSWAAEVERLRGMRADLAMDSPQDVLGRLVSDSLDGIHQVQAILQATRTLGRLLRPQALETLDVSTVVQGGVERQLASAARAGAGGAALEVVLPLAGHFPGRAQHWDAVVDALLKNAGEAARGGRVQIVAADAGLAIEDSGPGVPAALRDRIFLPYFSTRAGALGLGLPVAQGLARLGGGDVTLSPTPSGLGGARFEIRLPAEEKKLQNPQGSQGVPRAH